MLKWIRATKFRELFNVSVRDFTQLRTKGLWIEDREYRKAADGNFWVSLTYLNEFTEHSTEGLEEDMLQWVKLKKYYELSGDTANAFNHKKSRGIWKEGCEFRKAADGVIWINLKEVNNFAAKSVYKHR
ncbi:hypothetical protein KCM76_23390 [Zooshikella marina]|uniref:hypothetical protein n=1 Tax=Zooshikella ganghwensis TaxID=202772 RepID=UPI001BAF5421|nr:hypothetical protein [Zooshikella ganghwensis]MBU2708959.1 hypothetical protein [Zooshikella ganghwensis]